MDNYPTYVTIEQTNNIIEQLEKGICKIFMDEGGKGTGFFCYIKKGNSNISLPVLITNNHVLKEEAIKPGKKIKIAIYDNKNKQLKYKDIEIGDNRIVYTSEKYDTTIIEIKKEKDGINYFLDLDERIFQDNSNVFYYGSTIYILHNPGNKSPSVSYGILNKSNKYEYENIHFCGTESGSSGGPILSLSEMKVFGIHKGAFKHLDRIKGSFLKNPIEEFLLKSQKKVSLKNEIIIKFKSIVGRKNYFLDNTIKEEDNYRKIIEKLSHLNLKELNEFNTKLFIDEKEYKYQKYFNPKKEGIYSIKLKFNTQMKDCSHMFDNCFGIISIDLSSFDSSQVTNMSYMFNSCTNLSSINLNNFNTNLVTDMSYMFDSCGLELINLSSFNTSRVVDMSFMFSGISLESIDLSNFDTSNVKYMSYMFSQSCLQSIDLSMLNLKNLENKTYMFSKCMKKIKVNKQFIYDPEKSVGNDTKKNYYLTNSIIYKINSSEKFFGYYFKSIKKELDDCLFDVGFQIFSIKDDTLFGVLEGPILTPYQNGFFLFKMVYRLDYPFKPPKFIFITQIFHPNIDEEGNVSADILENEWTAALRTRATILSVQSLLSEPNSEIFVNQEAAFLYELSKDIYDETVKEYVNNYANYEIFKNKVKELNLEDIISISD